MWWRDEYGGTVVRDGGGSTRAVVGFVFVLMVVAFVFGFSVAGSEALNPGLTELRLEQAAAVRAQAEADAAESARYAAVAVEAARVRKADNEVLRVRAVEAGLGAAAAVVALIGAAVAYRVAFVEWPRLRRRRSERQRPAALAAPGATAGGGEHAHRQGGALPSSDGQPLDGARPRAQRARTYAYRARRPRQ